MFLTAEFGESEGQVFLSAAAVQVRNIRTLCDVGQNQRQAFLRGQIRGSTAQHAAWNPLGTYSDSPDAVNDFIQYNHVC